jgi:hypothetical protein
MKRGAKVSVQIGYAVGGGSRGVVYARIMGDRPTVLRADFCAEALEALAGGFAAIRAMAPLVRKHAADVDIQLDDAELLADLTQQRELQPGRLLGYVRARCALNTFASWRVSECAGCDDLKARALAEVSMRVAA